MYKIHTLCRNSRFLKYTIRQSHLTSHIAPVLSAVQYEGVRHGEESDVNMSLEKTDPVHQEKASAKHALSSETLTELLWVETGHGCVFKAALESGLQVLTWEEIWTVWSYVNNLTICMWE